VANNNVTEIRIARSTAMWMQARERLENDPDSNVDDLIGPSDRDL
jgi:hypothetical protein